LSDIRQNTERNRFEMDVDGGTAIAVYRPSPGVLTFTHTETPRHLRGRGIGSEMMGKVLTAVRAQGLKVVAACPFVADYMDRHPEFADLVA
jgi:predicted GNAT family acetyltransferase